MAYADRTNHAVQKSEYYDMVKKHLAQDRIEAASQVGCGKPSCCQVVTQDTSCICRSFNGREFLEKALKDDES